VRIARKISHVTLYVICPQVASSVKMMMFKNACLLLSVFLIFISCKVTESDAIGTFRLDRFPKTTLKVNTDYTFEFVKNNPNPYLHPFDHPDQYYSITKGGWTTIGRKIISLTSQNDSLIYPLSVIKVEPPRDKDLSNFTFYDTDGDTVKILYVQYADKSIRAALHRSIDYFLEDLTKRDTLEFHFYGYRPYTLISNQRKNQDYSITLKPAFQPGFFTETEFRIRKRQLIDIKRKAKFIKIQSGG
jgi:hypothetical protein